jgi:hypothetical protein
MLNAFLAGGCCLGFLVAALFFLKFWARSKDPLFLTFALAFGLLGVERIILIFFPIGGEKQPFVYLIRLIAFTIIIMGIIHKNRR